MMDKKKIVSIVLGESKPEEKKVSKGLESDFSPAYEAAAKDMIQAIKEDDAKKFASVLKDFFMMCEKEEDYQEEESLEEG
jgi:hypothetical protein